MGKKRVSLSEEVAPKAKKKPKKKGRKLQYDPEYVADISTEVYKDQLNQENPVGKYAEDKRTAVERMLDKDREKNPNDNGQRLRERAQIHASVVRSTLKALEARGELPEAARVKD